MMNNAINQPITQRYAAESQLDSNLSCGNTVSCAEIKPGDIILDLGCGRGQDTLTAARQTGQQGKAYGLDLTEKMVAIAKQNAQIQNIYNVEFQVGSIQALPYPDNQFNVIISNCVINHATDKKQVFDEIHRVLKPEGFFVISDTASVDPLPEEVKNDPLAWADCYGGAITQEEYLATIQAAGFENIVILKKRDYIKNSFPFMSLTIKGIKK